MNMRKPVLVFLGVPVALVSVVALSALLNSCGGGAPDRIKVPALAACTHAVEGELVDKYREHAVDFRDPRSSGVFEDGGLQVTGIVMDGRSTDYSYECFVDTRDYFKVVSVEVHRR